MKNFLAGASLLVFATLLLSACDMAETQAQSAEDALRERFVGHWELLSYVTISADGEERDMNYVGRLIYDPNGNMSGVGMPRDLPDRQREAGQERIRGGFAYFSSYTVDPEEGRVIHHVLGSPMIPSWVGTELVRYYEFTGDDQLALSLRDEAGRVTGTLTWRRM